MSTTKKLYNNHSNKWKRDKPQSLSDFTARPVLIKMCGDVKRKKILDLGCGEGYVTRQLIKKDPSSIDGLDISKKMIDLARKSQFDKRVTYQVGNAVKLKFEDDKYDLVIAVFLYNYMNTNQMKNSFKEVYRVLKKNGSFIFSVPHPILPFIKRKNMKKFSFNFKSKNYFSSRNRLAQGTIERIDGLKLPVQMIHKLFEDYNFYLKDAGFTNMPELKELKVTDKLIRLNKAFFNDLKDIPLHLAFKIKK